MQRARLASLLFPLCLFLWWMLLLLLSPVIILYGFLLLSGVWVLWAKEGKDALVVYSHVKSSQERMIAIIPLLKDRAIALNWSEKAKWPTWSIATQLFALYSIFFGPDPFAIENALSSSCYVASANRGLSVFIEKAARVRGPCRSFWNRNSAR